MLTSAQEKKFFQEYQKLNPGQKKAVDSLVGPVMVVAGPGTGKTQTLALRIVNILRQKEVQPEEILVLTFSDSATKAMRERLVKFLDEKAYYINLGTFHHFCNEIIQENPELFSFKKELKMMDDLQKYKLSKKILERGSFKRLSSIVNPLYHQREILEKISKLKKEGISPLIFKDRLKIIKTKLLSSREENFNFKLNKPKLNWEKKYIQLEKNLELSLFFEKYQKFCQEKGFYDYDDMILWVLKKLEQDKVLRDDYQGRFKYFLSDEYQDTNNGQNLLLEILSAKERNPNIFVVGDDDQSIYCFQGANLENILSFEKKYPALQIIPININYRSFSQIVNASNRLIANNLRRLVNQSKQEVSKNPISFFDDHKEKGEVVFQQFTTKDEEDFFIIKEIERLLKRGTALKEISILVRTNREIKELGELLEKRGIAFEFKEKESLLDNFLIYGFLKYLKALVQPSSNESLYTAMALPFFKISPKTLFEFNKGAYKKRKNLIEYFDFLKNSFSSSVKENEQDISKNVREKEILKELDPFFNRFYSFRKLSAYLPASLLLEKIINESGILANCLKTRDLETLNLFNSLYQFFKSKNQDNPNKKLSQVLEDLELMKEFNLKVKVKRIKEKRDGVQILTAHGSKGLEFENVFIPYFTFNNWGKKRTKGEFIKIFLEVFLGQELQEENKENERENKGREQKEKLEEERRLFFVALTRAKKKVFLSMSLKEADEEKEKIPSLFLEEIKDQVKIKERKPFVLKKELLEKMFLNLKNKEIFTVSERKKAEDNFLRKEVENLSLNPTSLNTYLTCPFKFKCEKLLQIPKSKNNTSILGSAVHKGLELFYQNLKESGKIKREILEEGLISSLEESIVSPKDLNKIKTEGLKILNDYFDFYKPFGLVSPLAVEVSFAKTFFEGAWISGKVDKIEEEMTKNHVNQNNNKKKAVKVIDYKTTTPKSYREVLGRKKNSDKSYYYQLIFYKLLSVLDKSFPFVVEGCEIDFLKPNNSGKFKKEVLSFSQDELADFKKKLKEVIMNIKSLNFQPIKDRNNNRKCNNCDYKDWCREENKDFC